MNIDRAKIVTKIRGLLSKTAENGCTEAETLAALDKARAMMDAYEVTIEDCQLVGETANVFASIASDPNKIRLQLGTAIARFCDCKVWKFATNQLNFCGLTADTELASWLLDTLANFVKRELRNFLATSELPKSMRRYQITGFVMGACSRISKRLNDLVEQSKIQASGNGRALVIAKGALIDTKMTDLGLKFVSQRRRTQKIDRPSYAAGQSAGDRAGFGKPIDGRRRAQRLT
jgi:hypothetical protein